MFDVDGNANAWSGLFCSLLGASTVFKVGSPLSHPHRQWYYNRLNPWEHYIPVSGELSDCLSMIDWLLVNQVRGAEIARNGRELAESMTMESELTQCARKLYQWLITKEQKHKG